MKPGVIITERGNSVLARGIRFFMRSWRWVVRVTTGIKHKRGYGNHAAIVIDTLNGSWQICEAVKEGVVIKWRESEGFLKREDCKMFYPKQPLTQEEIDRLQRIAHDVEGRRYEVWNFFWWVAYVTSFGKVRLTRRQPKDARKFYCFELVAYLSNAARPGLFDRDYQVTSIHDIEDNQNYKEI